MNAEQERLERVYAETVAHEKKRLGRNLTEFEKDRIRWDISFQTEYAGQYVIYVDRVLEKDGQPRLSREVLHHSAAWREIAEFTGGLSDEELQYTLIDYQPVLGL